MDYIPAQTLLLAYRHGLFPMAASYDSDEVEWFSPTRRGILPLDRFHIPRRLRRLIRRDETQGGFTIRRDGDFMQTLKYCAAPGPGREDSWISPLIQRSYANLYKIGYAHSIEAWQGGILVGGLYGVRLGCAFFGESMFSHVTDASKIALIHLVARMRLGGFSLLDTQYHTPHLKQFGAIEIKRADYSVLLGAALRAEASLPVAVLPEELGAFLHETSQTS